MRRRLYCRWHLGHCNGAYLPTSRGFDSQYGLLLGGALNYNKTYFHKPRVPNIYDFFQDGKLIKNQEILDTHQNVRKLYINNSNNNITKQCAIVGPLPVSRRPPDPQSWH